MRRLGVWVIEYSTELMMAPNGVPSAIGLWSNSDCTIKVLGLKTGGVSQDVSATSGAHWEVLISALTPYMAEATHDDDFLARLCISNSHNQ
jgi:hypothetical protein